MAESKRDTARATPAEEAARAAADAPRQAAESSARLTDQATRQTVEGMQAVGEVARRSVEQSSETGRQLYSAWVAGSEATLRATFDMQNAAIEAGLSLEEAATARNRQTLQRWAEVTRQAQQKILEAWQRHIRAAEEAAESARRATARGR